MNLKFISLIAIIFSISIPSVAHDGHSHSDDGKSKEWMIKILSTAAPSFIGNNASVATYDGKVLREGTNGWTCSPGRPMPKDGYKDAQDTNASCADIEGFKWVEAYVNGTKPDMNRDAYIWMLHGDVGPHLMLMPKDIKTVENFTTDFTTGEPYQMFKGTPYAHLMIPFEGYYMFQPEAAPK